MNAPTAPKITVTPAADKRQDLEEQFIGSLAGALVDTLQEAGWLDAATFQNPQYAELWRRVQATGANYTSFWATASELGIREQVDTAMTRQLSWQYGGLIATELTNAAWLADANSDMAALAQATAKGDHARAAELLARIQTAQPKAGQTTKIRDMTDAGVSFLEGVRQRNRSFITGIPMLDKATGGLERKKQTILAAPTSTGKSALALQIARNVAAGKRKALFFSLEMDEEDLFSRAACGQAGTTDLSIRRDELTPAQMIRLEQVSSEIMFTYGANLMIHDKPGTDLAQIWRLVAQARPDVFIVDHLRLVSERYGENENKRQGYICQRLREIGKEFDCHCLLLAQMSREQRTRSDKRPILSDLRDSGELEENADNVWMLYAPDDGSSAVMNRDSAKIELWVRKARKGIRDACVMLKYDRVLQWFE
jgi:replicative DNA helicase